MYGKYKDLLAKDSSKTSKAFDYLVKIHGLVSGLKAVGAWSGEHFGEFLKQACGGHGYL
jgi:hypothetical protein